MDTLYKTSHYKIIRENEDLHFWFGYRNRLVKNFIQKFVPDGRGKTFLEVGIGTGKILQIIKNLGFDTYGIDMNNYAVEVSQKRVNAKLYHTSLSKYCPKIKFDVIGAFDVLEHQKEDIKFLNKCGLLLKKRGYLFLTVPACKWLWNRIDVLFDHRQRYEKQELINILKKSGFSVIFISHWQSFTLPLYIMQRARVLCKNDGELISRYITPMPKILNEFLYRLLLFEQRFIFTGKLPIGASLIVCARGSK